MNDALRSHPDPMHVFREGGRVGTKPISIKIPRPPGYAKGGLHSEAKKVRDAGVGGDEMIVHINKQEYEQMVKEWGEPTINPHTGMPQFTPFWKQKWFAPVASIAAAALMATGVGAPIGAGILGAVGLPAAATGSFLGATGASILGNTVIGGATGAITGGGLKGGLTGAALGGLGTIGAGALGMTGPGVTGTGEGGFSAYADRMLSGDFFGSAAGVRAPHRLDGVAAGNPASVGNLGPQVPPGTVMPSASGGALGTLSKLSTAIPLAAAAASLIGGGAKAPADDAAAAGNKSTDPNLSQALATQPLIRRRTPILSSYDYYRYGTIPERQTYASGALAAVAGDDEDEAPVTRAAKGGAMPAGGPLSRASRYVEGPGTGRSDDIDAKLSNGEYVFDAETVAMLGDGSSEAGAKRLDQFRANLRKHKGNALAKGKFSPDAKNPMLYLGGRA
jgi:hypothetical protein